MTITDRRLVLDSFQGLEPAVAGRRFYERLFELDPSLREMFGSDVDVQADKFAQMLAFGIRGIGEDKQVNAMFRDMGKRHAGYGVEQSHYSTVRSALMSMLEEELGEDFTQPVREAWEAAFGEISRVMTTVETP